MNITEQSFFLEIVRIEHIACPLTKTIMLDPVQLVPCGHHVSNSGITRFYLERKAKICPTCQKFYDLKVDDNPLKEIIASFVLRIYKPNEKLKNKIMELYNILPISEGKQQIKDAIDLFSMGKINEGIDMIISVIMNSIQEENSESILDLMRQHEIACSEKINDLIKKASLFQVENNQDPYARMPISDRISPNIAEAINSLTVAQESPLPVSDLSDSFSSTPDLSQQTSLFLEVNPINPVSENTPSNNNSNKIIKRKVKQVIAESPELAFFKAIKKTGRRREQQNLLNRIKKVDVNATDKELNTAAHLLILHRGRIDPIEEYIRALYEQNAKLDVKNCMGQSPSDLAQELGLTNVKELLESLTKTDSSRNISSQNSETAIFLSRDGELIKGNSNSVTNSSPSQAKKRKGTDTDFEPISKRFRSNSSKKK